MSDNKDPEEEPKPEIRDRYYDAAKNGEEFISLARDANDKPIMMRNPEYRSFVGVPNRDIPAEEFAAFPLHIQRAIDKSPVHRLTKPQPVESADKADSKPRPASTATKADAKPAEPAKE
jgi:hypothetical protein